MDLTPYVSNLRQELAVAAGAGGDDARALAERLTAPLESAVRLVLLDALSAAAAEITSELAPGSVDLRLRGREPSFVVTAAPADDRDRRERPDATDPTDTTDRPAALAPEPIVTGSADGADDELARINLRLPVHLKTRVEQAAAR